MDRGAVNAFVAALLLGCVAPPPTLPVENTPGCATWRCAMSPPQYGTVGYGQVFTPDPLALIRILVTPDNEIVAGTQQYKAIGIYASYDQRDITSLVAWDTSDLSKATINSSGLLTRVADGGPFSVTATLDSKVGTATITTTSNTIVDLSSNPPPVTVTDDSFSGTGTLYLQDAAEHLAVATPTDVISESNDAGKRGVWVTQGIADAIAANLGAGFKNDISQWTQSGGGTSTPAAATGPDGVAASASRISDPNDSVASAAAIDALVAESTGYAWVKPTTGNVPTNRLTGIGPRALTPTPSYQAEFTSPIRPVPSPLPLGWKKLPFGEGGAAATMKFLPASDFPFAGAGYAGPLAVAGHGAADFWGAQVSSPEVIAGEARIQHYPPLTTGSYTKRIPRLTSPVYSGLVVGGDIDVEIRHEVSSLFGVLMWQKEPATDVPRYEVTLPGSDGAIQLKLYQDSSGIFHHQVLFNSVVLLDKTSNSATDKSVFGGRLGALMTTRFQIVHGSGGTASARLRVAYNGSVRDDFTVTGLTVASLAARTGAYLGQDGSGTRLCAGRYFKVTNMNGLPWTTPRPRIIVLGNSQAGAFATLNPSSDTLLTFAEADAGIVVKNLAMANSTFVSQLARFSAYSRNGDADVYFLNNMGINDCTMSFGFTIAQIIANEQALIDAIRTANPSAWIIDSLMTPCQGFINANPGDTQLQAKFDGLQLAKQDGSITGVDKVITKSFDELDTLGSGILQTPYLGSGDGLHMSEFGRGAVTFYGREAIVEGGFLYISGAP